MQSEIVKRRLLTSVISAPLALALLTTVLLWHLQIERSYSRSLIDTRYLVSAARSVQNRVDKAQIALEDFLLSGAQSDLSGLRHALNDTEISLRNLLNSATGDARIRLVEVKDRQGRWSAAVQNLIDHGSTPAPAGAANARIKPLTHALLVSLDDFTDSESRFLHALSVREHDEQILVMWLVPLCAAAVALALVVISWRDINAVVGQYERVVQDAEEANLKTNNFLATISHELRNPLNLILLWSHLLLSGERDEDKVVRGLSSIDHAAQSQAQLIEDLLDLAKIESGRLQLDLQPTDLPAVVRAGVQTMSATAEAKSIELRVIIDPRAGLILGDAQRLQQALWNLLSNAVKFTPAGGTEQVQLARINSHVELAVSDSGQGIAPSLLPHVFDRFWQGDQGTLEQKKGMGLGLTIVKHIVTMHGGAITVHSDGVGRGATFTMRLPIASEGHRYMRRPHTRVVTTPEFPRIERLAGLQILVVDDDQEANEALRAILKSLGADPVVADSVERALDLLDQHRPDLVLSDIGMPGRDGLSLAREIRDREQQEAAGHLPLVALTAYGRVEDRVKIFSAGFDSHVVKPVDPAELAAVIRSVVERVQ
jgi:signal transduction histidine kinase/ActR/RegA family two-component response regulator